MMSSAFYSLLVYCSLVQSGDVQAERVPDPSEQSQSPSQLQVFVDENSIESKKVDEVFDQVLSDQEFRRLQRMSESSKPPGWLQRFLDWLFGPQDAQRRESSPWVEMLATFVYYLVWALAVTALAFVGWILLRAILRHLEDDAKFRKPTEVTAEQILELSHPPGELPSDEYERRALALAQTADYKSAVRELVLGSMSWIERAGLIRYRKGLTNRDYVRAIWRKQSERSSLEHIVRVFERAYFGRRTPDRASFELCLEHYQRAFIGEEILVET